MTERQAPAGCGGPPYGMLRAGLRAGAVDWILARVPTLRRNPFALGYLAVVGATTTFAGLADPELVLRLQEASSSDGHNLLQHPLRALLFSGFWVAGPVWMPYLWAFAFTVAPLERRVGPGRAAVVFAAGHVAATLLSQGVVVVAVETGRMGRPPWTTSTSVSATACSPASARWPGCSGRRGARSCSRWRWR